MNGKRLLLLLSVMCPVIPAALGQTADITLHSTVSGNQEQPKVMYILPWQQPSDLSIEQNSSAKPQGDLYVALDRDEFVRELNYRATMNAAPDVGGNESVKTLLNNE